MLRDFVRGRGGGMLFVAGEQHMPHSYRETPLADILPVTLGGVGDLQDPNENRILQDDLNDGYRLRLTTIGQQHPIFRFAPEDAENAAILQELSLLHYASVGYRLKAATEVLATHPVLAARRNAGEVGEEFHALVVQSFVGTGRVMFFGFDETWRWRYREHEIRFNQFWMQTARYLART